MPPLYVLIKPASGSCNLRCKYCFYTDVAKNRNTPSYGIMTEEVIEAVIKKSLEHAERTCTFGFQGGEPTLAGLDFFKKVVELEKKHNLKKLKIYNSIQTNGININNEWASFLAENDFLTGLSLDGIKTSNDANRVYPDGSGSYKEIMHAVQLFNSHKVQYNILTVVTAQVARNIGKIYGFYKRSGLLYQQYIPCINPFGENNSMEAYTLTPKLYGEFLINLFDLWFNDVMKNNFISIRYFENLAEMLAGEMPESCGMLGRCSVQNVVESDGSVYPCDFYVVDKWKLGNLVENSFEDINRARTEKKFIEASLKINEKCLGCKYLNICRGGCRRYREPVINDNAALNYFCESYKMFFDYSINRLNALVSLKMSR